MSSAGRNFIGNFYHLLGGLFFLFSYIESYWEQGEINLKKTYQNDGCNCSFCFNIFPLFFIGMFQPQWMSLQFSIFLEFIDRWLVIIKSNSTKLEYICINTYIILKHVDKIWCKWLSVIYGPKYCRQYLRTTNLTYYVGKSKTLESQVLFQASRILT